MYMRFPPTPLKMSVSPSLCASSITSSNTQYNDLQGAIETAALPPSSVLTLRPFTEEYLVCSSMDSDGTTSPQEQSANPAALGSFELPHNHREGQGVLLSPSTPSWSPSPLLSNCEHLSKQNESRLSTEGERTLQTPLSRDSKAPRESLLLNSPEAAICLYFDANTRLWGLGRRDADTTVLLELHQEEDLCSLSTQLPRSCPVVWIPERGAPKATLTLLQAVLAQQQIQIKSIKQRYYDQEPATSFLRSLPAEQLIGFNCLDFSSDEENVVLCTLSGLMAALSSTSSPSLPLTRRTRLCLSRQKGVAISRGGLRGLQLFGCLSAFQSHQTNCSSLFSLLHPFTSSAAGSRLLRNNIRRPLDCEQQIQQRLDTVELFVDQYHTSAKLKAKLQGTADRLMAAYESLLSPIPEQTSRTEKAVAERLASAVRLHRELGTCVGIAYILSELGNAVEIVPAGIQQAKEVLQEDKIDELRRRISKHINIPPATTGKRKAPGANSSVSLLMRSANKELEEKIKFAKRNLDETNTLCGRLMVSIEAQCRGVQIRREWSSAYGKHFSVATSQAPKVGSLVQEFTELKRRGDQVYFTDILLSDANVTAKKLEEDVVVLQLPVLEGLKDCLFSDAHWIWAVYNALAFIDFLMALALWASHFQGVNTPVCRPQFTSKSTRVVSAVHPLVTTSGSGGFSGFDFEQREDKNNGVLLMGPNGSGKSSYLRTLGLMHVLAQMGSLVPAISAEMRLTNSIHVCSPSLLKGSNHEECTQLIDAVRAATAKDRKYQNNKHRRSKNRNNRCSLEENKDEANDASLILIDEIFRSVPHAEGFSVCWAVLEEFVRQPKTFVLFATHFTELQNLRRNNPFIETHFFCCSTGENGLTPLFKIAKNSEEAEAAQMAYGVLGSKGKLNKIIVEEAEAFIAEADGALMPHAQCLQTVEITRWAYEIIHLLENAVSSFSIHSTTDSRNSSNTSSSNNSHRRFLRLLEEAQRVIEVVCVETDA